MAYAIQGSVIIDDSRQLIGVSTLGSGNINVSAGASISIGAGGAYYGDGRTLSGVVTTGAGGTTLTEGDAHFEANVEVEGNIVGLSNLNIGSDITVGRNLDVTGIATVNDIYVENLLYDSNGNTGGIGSVLAVLDNKLQWVLPAEAGIATEFQPGSTFFVAENGHDDASSDGLSPEKSWKSLTYALSQIPTTGLENDILYVGAGNYEETFPLEIPAGLTIKGAGQRATFIKPTSATETEDGFKFNDRSTLQDMTVGGFYKPQGSQNFAFSYAVGAALTQRSPYISAVTLLNKGSEVTAADPYGFASADAYPATAPAGGGVKVDGSVLDSTSIEAGFLLNELTAFVPAATGIEMTNGARVEWLNGFTYFADKGVHGVSGTSGLFGAGQTRLTLQNATGGLVAANTIELYDTDGATVIASGTVDSTSGNYVYLTNKGTGTFSVPRLRDAKTVAFVESAELTTSQAKFGTASLDVTADGLSHIAIATQQDFGFGTGEFTIEGWFRFTSTASGAVLWDFRGTSATDSALSLKTGATDSLQVQVGNTTVATSGSSVISTGTWQHIAVTRDGSNVRLWVDGVQAALGTSAANLGTSQKLNIGSDYSDANGVEAYIDEVRIEKGVAKYLTPFTAPTAAFKGDADTVLLLHLNGSNGATETTEDVEVFQDIRISGGNTAEKITLADYSEFGADLRSSSSAVEYGNQGVVGDGAGVKLRLVSINFSFVGANGSISNDPNTATQANEVLQSNGAEVSYTSVDHLGNFRVGESFFVNQETGEVSFEASNFDLTSLSSLTITDGVNSSDITPTSGRFGSLQISGNTLESVTGDVNIQTAGAGEVNIFGDVNVAGILTAQVVQIDSITKNDTSIALDDTGNDGTIRFNTDGVEAGRFTNEQDFDVTRDIGAGRDIEAFRDVIVGRNLQVQGRQDVDEFFATNMFITGIATVGSLDAYTEIKGNTGVITAISAETLAVSGLTTLTGNVLASNDVGIGSTLTVTLDGIFGQDVSIGRSFASVGDGLIGGDLGVTGDIGAAGNIIGDNATNISGIDDISAVSATFTGNVSIEGNTTLGNSTSDFITFNGRTSTIVPSSNGGNDLGLTGQRWRNVYANDLIITNGATLGGNLTVSGNTQLGNDYANDTVTFVSQVSSLITPKADSAFDLGTNLLRWKDLYVDGITITNDVTIGGDLDVTGDITLAHVTAANATVTGIATITEADLGVVGIDTLTVSGHSQLATLATTGIATVGESLVVTNNTTSATLNVTGVSTLAATNAASIAVTNDVTVGGDLAVTDNVTTDSLRVTGLSTFVGMSTFVGDVYVQGNLIVDGDNSQDLVDSTNLRISGVTTLNVLEVEGNATFTGSEVRLDGADLYAEEDVYVTGVVSASSYLGDASALINLPPASLTTTTAPTTRINNDALQEGDLWFDSSAGNGGVRQYTYFDGGWVDSNAAPVVPDLNVSVGGVSTIPVQLYNATLDFQGTANEVTVGLASVGVGSTAGAVYTIGLPDDVTITDQLTVSGITSAVGQLQFNSGIGSALTVDKLTVQNFQVGDQGLVFQQARAVNVMVTGVATHNSHVYNSGIGTYSSVTGILTTAQLEVGTGNVVTGITTVIDTDGSANNDELVTELGIKNYVDSRVESQIHDLDFSGDVGISSIALANDTLLIAGTAEKITTVGAGNSITISLPNTVRVNQRFLIGGGTSGFTQMADFNTTGITFGKKLDLGTNNLASVGAIYASGIGSFAANVTVGGDLTAVGDITANDYNSTSDIRKKENIVGISSGLAKVEAIRGVTFDWKDSEGSSAGVIAQEVEAVLPEVVSEREDGTKTVNYNGLVGTLIEAVKELSARVEELEAKLQD